MSDYFSLIVGRARGESGGVRVVAPPRFAPAQTFRRADAGAGAGRLGRGDARRGHPADGPEAAWPEWGAGTEQDSLRERPPGPFDEAHREPAGASLDWRRDRVTPIDGRPAAPPAVPTSRAADPRSPVRTVDVHTRGPDPLVPARPPQSPAHASDPSGSRPAAGSSRVAGRRPGSSPDRRGPAASPAGAPGAIDPRLTAADSTRARAEHEPTGPRSPAAGRLGDPRGTPRASTRLDPSRTGGSHLGDAGDGADPDASVRASAIRLDGREASVGRLAATRAAPLVRDPRDGAVHSLATKTGRATATDRLASAGADEVSSGTDAASPRDGRRRGTSTQGPPPRRDSSSPSAARRAARAEADAVEDAGARAASTAAGDHRPDASARGAASQATAEPERPRVEVRIGRLEIRVVPPPIEAPGPAPTPSLSLGDYLRSRGERS